MEIIENHMDSISALCAKHKVSKLFVFGSILEKSFSKESDIDLIVNFDNVDLMNYADNYFDFKFSLENLFKREVDLLEEQAIKNPYLRESIDSSKKLIYG